MAISRRIGAMPQLVQARIFSFATYFIASAMVAATSSGVSTLSVATSITPISTSLPSSSLSSLMGTFELRHSIDTWSMRLSARAGNIASYCRHSPPSPAFQSILALIP